VPARHSHRRRLRRRIAERLPRGHGRIERIVVFGQRRVGIDVGRRLGTVQHGSRAHVTPARRLARVDWRGEHAQRVCLPGGAAAHMSNRSRTSRKSPPHTFAS
jgi:hypothetical protein